MENKVELDSIYRPSEDVVAREVQGEFIIIPVTSGVADMEDEIFSLNETGKAIWDNLDGKRSLKKISVDLATAYEASPAEIERDVLGLSEELFKRRMLVRVK